MHRKINGLKDTNHGVFREYPTLGLSIDLTSSGLDWGEVERKLGTRLERAIVAMQELEAGKIANPDENRMVGHYWLRNPRLAPTPQIRADIENTLRQIEVFAHEVHTGKIAGQTGRFKNLLLIGIGGSSLGPQLAAHALRFSTLPRLKFHCLDNTDPDGMFRTINDIGNEIGQTICIVVSKSGKTKETHNGMVFIKNAFERAGLAFEKHAVAVTMPQSKLDRYAKENGWLGSFPIWEWVGGRTSFFSAVTLLPAALMGAPIKELLAGARACDEATRLHPLNENPALQLAATWYWLAEVEKKHCVAIIPYKDSLEFLSRFLQQLVMESLGKEMDLDRNVANTGLVVFGNKGSTDQHSYVQQLRDGINNTFTTFVNLERNTYDLALSENTTIGDYLYGFSIGTRKALAEKSRRTITVTILDCSYFSLGVIIGLFERSVGFMATLLNINAYHQPGVEAGKLAAEQIVELKNSVCSLLRSNRRIPFAVHEISEQLKYQGSLVVLSKICDYLSANGRFGIQKVVDKDDLTTRFVAI